MAECYFPKHGSGFQTREIDFQKHGSGFRTSEIDLPKQGTYLVVLEMK